MCMGGGSKPSAAPAPAPAKILTVETTLGKENDVPTQVDLGATPDEEKKQTKGMKRLQVPLNSGSSSGLGIPA